MLNNSVDKIVSQSVSTHIKEKERYFLMCDVIKFYLSIIFYSCRVYNLINSIQKLYIQHIFIYVHVA